MNDAYNLNLDSDDYLTLGRNNIDEYYDIQNFNTNFDSLTLNDLGIFHLNIRSLPRNGNELVSFLSTLNHRFSVICCSETWLNSNRFIENLFPNYNQYHSMRPSNQPLGGGVAIFIHKDLQSEYLADISCNNGSIECVFASINHRDKNFVIGCCYRQPDPNNTSEFISSLVERIMSIDSSTLKIIAGDFNFNLLNIENDQNSASFFDAMLSLGLVNSISKISRVTSGTLLDNIFISHSLQFESGLLKWDISDHYPIFSIFNNLLDPRSNSTKIKFRLLNTSCLDNLYESLTACNFDGVLNNNELDEAFVNFDTILLDHLNQFCPIISKTITKRDREKPWIKSDLKILIFTRQRKYLDYRQGILSFDDYKPYRNYVNRQITIAKNNYFTNLLNNVKSDMKKTWSTLNTLLKPNSDKSTSHIDKIICNNVTIDNNLDICNLFNNHFSSIGSRISSSFSGSHDAFVPASRINNSFFFRPVTSNDINTVISNLENKSNGLNTYSAKILKHIKDIISPILASLFTKSLLSSHFPSQFKIARVIPLHKGNSKHDLNNYRPISLLPLLSKLLERVVYNQVWHFLDTFNLISSNQYGFRRNRSTTMAVLNNLDYVYENLDQGNTVVSIFMDFSKAFDCIDHQILLRKLHSYGIRGIALDWFRSYLNDRKQYVVINFSESELRPITHGVPQGSILGPLLFLIFINDFPESNRFFNFTLFADDSTLSCNFNNVDEDLMKNTIESQLIPVYNWLSSNKIKINLDKSNFIIFSYRKSYNLNALNLGTGSINSTDQTKFLGMMIDKNLNFKSHIASLCAKLAQASGMLFRLNNILPQHSLTTLYYALFLPHLMYGIEIWFNILAVNDDRIFKLQKKAIRAIHSLPYGHHTSEFFKQMKVLKVHDLYKLRALSFAFCNDMNTLSDVHDHHTRNRNNLVLPLYRRARTQSTLFYRSRMLWNSLPIDLKNTQSLGSFKNKVKIYYLSSY